ncbi:hypothetical protein LGZ99_05705 [Photorhabdus temperata]|uniref:hypothetical protein n=1 Tax=Photorhabdus temperata TaxID=574560 RepID=UPI0021D519C0|nr:hypothetical protein [Photorhabdus temperata]MCT8346721.1 hypothetical protein [Photorhabdus temperata]
MKVAILGATSQIAKDLLRQWSDKKQKHELYLFARRITVVEDFISTVVWHNNVKIYCLEQFTSTKIKFDAILNFIGISDPSLVADRSTEIIDVTSYKIKANIINATGLKKNYYSTNYKARMFGYNPCYSSLDTISIESSMILNTAGNNFNI